MRPTINGQLLIVGQAHLRLDRCDEFVDSLALLDDLFAPAGLLLIELFFGTDGYRLSGARAAIACQLSRAALVIAAPHVLRAPAFDHPWLWWLGLSTVDPRSNDYVPLFPWFGAVLAGIGVTRLAASAGLLERMADVPLGRAARPLTFIGRHSLAFYLIHQPVLIACVWLVAQVAPPTQLSPQEAFTSSCHASCQQVRDKAFCVSYCGCMLDKLGSTNMLSRLDQGDADPQLRARIADLASTCTVETEDTAPEEAQ